MSAADPSGNEEVSLEEHSPVVLRRRVLRMISVTAMVMAHMAQMMANRRNLQAITFNFRFESNLVNRDSLET